MATKEQIIDEMNKKEELNKARLNALSFSLRLLELDIAYLKHDVKLEKITDNSQIKIIEDMSKIISSIKGTYNLDDVPMMARTFPLHLEEGE